MWSAYSEFTGRCILSAPARTGSATAHFHVKFSLVLFSDDGMMVSKFSRKEYVTRSVLAGVPVQEVIEGIELPR